VKKILFVSLILRMAVAHSQDKLGINNSNYFPVSSIFLNPSSSADSRSFIQLNVIGADVYAKTNLAYLPDFSLWTARSSGIPAPKISETEKDKFLYAHAVADGPVFIMSKGRFGAGGFVRARTVFNVRRMPYELSSLILNQDMSAPEQGEFNSRNAGFNNMSWLEYGGNFSMMIKRERTQLITAGVNLKYINGINIFYANLNELRGSYSTTYMDLDTVRGKIKYNSAALGSGKGFGADLGFTYRKMLGITDAYYAHSVRSNCNYIDYKYKLGLSLRDLGYLRFTGNTSVADVNGSAFFSTDETQLSYQPYLNSISNTTFSPLPITAFLPASASAQFDYNFENSLYLNATVIKNLVPGQVTGVQGPDLVSICPRYEFRYFEVAMPLTFHRFIYPQIGFGMRFRSLVIGMDNMVPLFLARNTYGLNVYFNLAVTIFRNPSCNTAAPRVADCPKLRSAGPAKRGGALRKLLRGRKTYSR
jgi:hypothetical protein